MLRGIHPLLSPDLLHALATMGHGDELVIADANFPASTLGVPVVRADGLGAEAVLEAILTHMPLDTFAPVTAWRMEIVGDPETVPPVCASFQQIVSRLSGDFRIAAHERFAFYAAARRAAYVVATGETALYGNLIVKKGVVRSHETAAPDEGLE